MTSEQIARKAEFDSIFEALPGTNVDRIKAVAAAIHVKQATVRAWRLRDPHRVISERSLVMLKQALSKAKR